MFKSLNFNFSIIFTFILIIFVSFSCKQDNIIEPEPDYSGRTDYEWTADTLWSEDWFGVTDVWGDSPNSIWLTTFATTPKDALWHYDGSKWSKFPQVSDSDFNTVFGVNSDEIWLGDSYGRIWRNKGDGWEKFKTLTVEGYDWIRIEGFCGTEKNNLYAVGTADHWDASGYKGIILKYDGIDWKLLSTSYPGVGFHDIKRLKNGKHIIWGSNDDNGFLEKLFIWNGDSIFTEIYSDYSMPALYEMNGEIYINITNRIFKCINDSMVIWKEFPESTYHGTVLGRSENDFFGAGWDGILHYDGSEWKNLYQTNINLTGYLLFDRDIIYAGYDNEKQLVIMIRGTLKDK